MLREWYWSKIYKNSIVPLKLKTPYISDVCQLTWKLTNSNWLSINYVICGNLWLPTANLIYNCRNNWDMSRNRTKVGFHWVEINSRIIEKYGVLEDICFILVLRVSL